MSVRNFKKIESDDPVLNRVQQKIQDFLTPFIRSPIIDGVLITNVNLQTGQANPVEHKLDRKIQGWIAVRQRGQAQIWDAQDTNDLPTRTLDLRTDANVSVDLWIF